MNAVTHTLHARALHRLRRRVAWAIAFATLFALATADGFAQAESRSWVGIGAGIGYVAAGSAPEQDVIDNAGVGVLYVSSQRGANGFSLRGAGAIELFGDGIADLGLLYGRATTGGGSYGSFGIGVAVVTGSFREDGLDLCGILSDRDDCPDTSPQGFTTVGIPLEVQLALRGRHVGIGIYGFANLNPESSFVGATVSLHVGRLY